MRVNFMYPDPRFGFLRLSGGGGIGVFHYMAGMAAAMPGLIKFPSTGKEFEANR